MNPLFGILIVIYGLSVIAPQHFKAPSWFGGLMVTVRAAVILSALGLMVLGLTGSVVMILYQPVLDLIYGPLWGERLRAGAWSLAYQFSLFWPFSFPLGYLVARVALGEQKEWLKHLTFIAVVLLLGLELSIFLVGLDIQRP